MAAQFLWSNLASAKWEDAWVERLQCLGPGRLAIFAIPGSRSIRLETYGLKSRDAARLVAAFGGQVRKMKSAAAFITPAETAPLLIRDRLIVVRSPRAARAAARSHPGRPLLIIPAAMAFGTASVGGDREDRTLVFLLVRPIPRALVLLAKFIAALPLVLGLVVGEPEPGDSGPV